jgi:hypothetical protein
MRTLSLYYCNTSPEISYVAPDLQAARFSASSPPPQLHHVVTSHHAPTTQTMATKFVPLSDRPIKNTLVLFDVDGTLTPARRVTPPRPQLGFVSVD